MLAKANGRTNKLEDENDFPDISIFFKLVKAVDEMNGTLRCGGDACHVSFSAVVFMFFDIVND